MTRPPAEPPSVASLFYVVLLKRTRTGWQIGVGPASTGIIQTDAREFRSAGAARTAALALAQRKALLVLRSDD